MRAIFTVLSVLLLTISAANAAVVKKIDEQAECTLFSLKHASNGGAIKLNSGESIHEEGTIYGFTFRDAKVDFDSRQITARAEILKFGFNKDLRKKVVIGENLADSALKQLNRKVLTMDEVCISRDGELKYFNLPK